MDDEIITRAYLESLSCKQLFDTAAKFEIDFSENTKRALIIDEICNAVEDNEQEKDDITEIDTIKNTKKDIFFRNYNTTEIGLMLRNPVWAFVYWNISEADKQALEEAFISRIMIRINSFSEKNQQKHDDFFDIKISKEDNGQYIFLSAGKNYFRADLIFEIDGIIDILASSEILEKPKGASFISETRLCCPAKEISPIMELSGIKDILTEFYKQHRESFL